MFKKIKTFFVFMMSAFAVFFTYANLSFAHTLEYDKSIGAVVHVSPNDNPAIGEPSIINVEITDTENRFDSAKCECTYQLLLNDQKIIQDNFTAEKTSSGTYFFSVEYTFEQKGVYIFELQGKPKDSLFNDFNLSYDVRVARDGKNPETHEENHLLHYIIFGIGFIVAIIVLSQDKDSKKN